MYSIEYTTQFKKDFRKAAKRGLKVDFLEKVISFLEKEGKLPPIYKPHKLKGNYAGAQIHHTYTYRYPQRYVLEPAHRLGVAQVEKLVLLIPAYHR